MTTYTVTNAPTLYTALVDAIGGDRIELVAGDYGDVNIRDTVFSSDVTLVSADPANPAVFRDLYLRGSSHLVFDGIRFDYVFADGDSVVFRPFEVLFSTYITIRNSVFDDALVAEGKYGSGIGLQIADSNNIVIENNEFINWYKAFGVGQSANVTVRANDVHETRSDGFNFVTVDGLLVEGNWFHDFMKLPGSGDHADMIQFWTVLGETSSRNVTIRGNFFDASVGDLTQSLFMRNGIVDTGQGSFEDYAYVNILIENNVIYNHHTHGITVGETDGLTISNNTLLNDPHVRVVSNISPRINVKDASLNVTINNNILESMWQWPTLAVLPGWSIVDNIFVQFDDPSGESYYGDLFVAPFAVDATLADLRALPGGVIEVGVYGAEMTRADIPMVVGPYASASLPDPVPEPGVCEALLAEALAVVADFEAQLAASQAALATMTNERDIAEADGDVTLILLVAMTAERDTALTAQAVALADLAVAQAQLAVEVAKLDAIRVIVEG